MSNIQTYTGDGSTTTFYFTFPFFGTSDVKVSVGGATQTSDDFAIYPTASPAPADTPYIGGRIDFAVAPSNGTTVKIWRDIEVERHIDYQPTAQPQSHQLNQDVNQCIEILKELAETLTNIVSLSNVPTLNDLLSDLTDIQTTLGTLATAASVTELSNTVDDHTGSISNLDTTVDGHTTSINTLNGYDYVVELQMPNAENNYTWYRKYKSGWVEMGGTVSTANDTTVTISLPITMADTLYNVQKTGIGDSSSISTPSFQTHCISHKTTTSFKTFANSLSINGFMWIVSGVSA